MGIILHVDGLEGYLTYEAGHAQDSECYVKFPVAHCKVNTIELAWDSVKKYVAKHNKDYNLRRLSD